MGRRPLPSRYHTLPTKNPEPGLIYERGPITPYVIRRVPGTVGGRSDPGFKVLKAEPTPPLRPAKWAHFAFQHGLLLPSPPASLWPPAAERRLEAAVLVQDSSPAAPLWW
jgi:hypothetical protein